MASNPAMDSPTRVSVAAHFPLTTLSTFGVTAAIPNVKVEYGFAKVATGNGRDAFFLSKYTKFVFGIDKSKIAIDINNKKADYLDLKNISFKNLKSQQIKFFKKKITFIYARFFIHAISEKVENKFLNDLKNYFGKKVTVGLEFRTTNDLLINKGIKIGTNERFYTHYRRFVDLKKFEKKLKDKNFKILYKKVGVNLSKTSTENPYLCRLIIRQK